MFLCSYLFVCFSNLICRYAPKFAGIGGLIPEIEKLKVSKKLDHPIFKNLREGLWLLDYHIARFKGSEAYHFEECFVKALNSIKSLPKHLIPKYFAHVLYTFYHNIREHILSNSNHMFFVKIQNLCVKL